MQIFSSNGYRNLIGFDFAQNMVERGRKTYPNFDIRLLTESSRIPCADESVDAIVMSTVFCCMTETAEQVKLIKEILRV